MTSPAMQLPVSLRIALRELRGGFSGFAVFIACIALGVAAIASVGSVSRALVAGIEQEGQAILGGDVAFRLSQRQVSAEERAFLESMGDVSEIGSVRAMARLNDSSDQTLVEVKGVDGAYPLYGELELAGNGALKDALTRRGNHWGVVVEEALLGRLQLEVGDTLSVGGMPVVIAGVITREPDRLSGGLTFGPRVMLSNEALTESGMVRPGSLSRWRYTVRLNDTSDAALQQALTAGRETFPQAGWSVRGRDNAAPRIADQIKRFRDYLTLVGLTALAVGGVGVANAVRAHLDTRRTVIATLKAVGATGSMAVRVYLLQILMLGSIAILIGLVIGAIAPLIAGSYLSALFPVADAAAGIYWSALLLAAIYGLLAALAFAITPLGRAREVPVSALYRDHVSRDRARAPWGYIAAALGCGALLAGLAIGVAEEPRVAAMLIAGAAGGYVFLRLVAAGLMALARRGKDMCGRIGLRMALANIHRPNALTPTIVLSLGLGLTLLVALALVEANLKRQLAQSLPAQAPDYFFVDVPSTRASDFVGLIDAVTPGADVEQVPMLRGRIIALKGQPADTYPVEPGAAWVLRGDRGITYSTDVPEGSELVAGDWWGADYDGKPLVSFEAELADELNLVIGDTVTVNVLGRDITVEIANLRTVEWETMGINFVMVFSPNALAGAPHMMLTTVSFREQSREADAAVLMREVATGFPEVTAVRVKEALDTFAQLLGRLALAVRAASSITLVAAVLVLAGALASSHRFRIYDAVVLKTLGASRSRLVMTYALEFLLLGAATALFALTAGTAAAWFTVSEIMGLEFAFAGNVAMSAVSGAVAVTVLLGLIGTWRALGQRPAGYLRSIAAA